MRSCSKRTGGKATYRFFTVLLVFPMILGIVGDSHAPQLRKEASLRAALFLLRTEVDQFTRDHQREPASLFELVSSGYLKRLPIDPFTRRNDTWRLAKSGNDVY